MATPVLEPVVSVSAARVAAGRAEQYMVALVPDGASVAVGYSINGQVAGQLGPRVVHPLPGRNVAIQLRAIAWRGLRAKRTPDGDDTMLLRYRTIQVQPGDVVRAGIEVDGGVVGSIGPLTAPAQGATVEFRLRVDRGCELSGFPVAVGGGS